MLSIPLVSNVIIIGARASVSEPLLCSNSADLANQQLFVSGPGNVSTRGQIIDINRSPKIEIPIARLRKRQHSAPGSLSQISPREAERLRDGYDSTPDPAYSCLRCSAQRQCDMAAVPSAVQSAGRL